MGEKIRFRYTSAIEQNPLLTLDHTDVASASKLEETEDTLKEEIKTLWKCIVRLQREIYNLRGQSNA